MRARSIAVLVVLLAVPALAAKPRVLIDAPPALSKIITKLISKKYTPTPLKAPLSAEPTTKEVADATRDYAAVAVVQARLLGKQWSVRVLNGADGTPLGTVEFKNAKKLTPPKSFGPALLSASQEGAAPAVAAPPATVAKAPTPAPTPTPAASKPPEPVAAKTEPPPTAKAEFFDDSAQPEAPKERPTALRFGIGFTGLNRNYTYRDDIFDALSKYRLPFGPAPSAELEFFPGALFTSGIAANFGIRGAFNYVVGVSSVANGVKFASSSMKLQASLVGRIPIRMIELQLGVGYGMQSFGIAASANGTERPNIPNVSYGGIRPMLEATVHFSPIFGLHLGGAYQVLISKGELAVSPYFPRSVGGGADMWVAVSVKPMQHFAIRLQGDYSRYFFALKPQVGDTYVAGGALDEYLSGTITANLLF